MLGPWCGWSIANAHTALPSELYNPKCTRMSSSSLENPGIVRAAGAVATWKSSTRRLLASRGSGELCASLMDSAQWRPLLFASN